MSLNGIWNYPVSRKAGNLHLKYVRTKLRLFCQGGFETNVRQRPFCSTFNSGENINFAKFVESVKMRALYDGQSDRNDARPAEVTRRPPRNDGWSIQSIARISFSRTESKTTRRFIPGYRICRTVRLRSFFFFFFFIFPRSPRLCFPLDSPPPFALFIQRACTVQRKGRTFSYFLQPVLAFRFVQRPLHTLLHEDRGLDKLVRHRRDACATVRVGNMANFSSRGGKLSVEKGEFLLR